MTKRKRQSLQSRHGGHFLDAVDEQGRARIAQHKRKNSIGRRKAKMRSAAYEKQGIGAAPHELADFVDARRADFVSAAREAVRAAHFLNRRGRQREELFANAKKNDLL